MVAFPPFRLDLDDERLWRGGKLLAVRRKPFAILRHLVANPGRLVTHEELLAHVWGGTVVSESAVRTHVHELRQLLGEGLIETVIGRGYRFTAQLVDDDPAAGDLPAALALETMIVGRDAELETLTAALARATAGHRQLCFVTGEPGIGKTTLVDAFLATIEGRSDLIAVRGHCVEQHGTPEAYLAVIELLGRLRSSEHGDRVVAALVRHAPTFVAQVPQLVPDTQLDEVARRAQGGSESKIVRELIETLETLSSQSPMVVVLEDLQWSDVATLDLLAVLGQRRERAKLLVIATARHAEAQTVSHPLNRVVRGLVARSGGIAMHLERIDLAQLGRLIELRFPGHAFPPEFGEVVDRITAGTPIFVIALLDELVGRAMIVDRGGWRLAVSADDVAAHRPASIKQLIDLQLDRLTPQEQRVLEAASAVGVEFATTLVAAALDATVEHTDELCDALARRELFLRRAASEDWPDGTLQTRYAVIHGLVQEVCLERTAPARRERWHRLVADRLEAAYGERAAEIAHVLASHLDRGQAAPRAVHYYVLAAERTARRYASPDATVLFRRALDLLQRLPDSAARNATELRILQGLSSAVLRNRDDHRDPLALFERMVELARGLDDTRALCAALLNASVRHATLADYDRALALCDQVDALRARHPFDAMLVEFLDAARLLPTIWRGDVVAALAMLDQIDATPTPAPNDGVQLGILGPSDRRTVMVAYRSMLRWIVGQPDAAMRDAHLAITLARAAADPYTLGLGYCNLARLRIMRGEPAETVREAAEVVLALPDASVWHPQASLLVAWAASRAGTLDGDGADQLLRDFRGRVARFPMGTTHLSLPVIEALRHANRLADASALTEEALAFARGHGELVFEAELVRLRGELVEAADRAAAAAAYLEAAAIARARSAWSLELRAANRLAALWAGADRAAEARAMVAAALAHVSEGDATVDVIEARRHIAT